MVKNTKKKYSIKKGGRIPNPLHTNTSVLHGNPYLVTLRKHSNSSSTSPTSTKKIDEFGDTDDEDDEEKADKTLSKILASIHNKSISEIKPFENIEHELLEGFDTDIKEALSRVILKEKKAFNDYVKENGHIPRATNNEDEQEEVNKIFQLVDSIELN